METIEQINDNFDVKKPKKKCLLIATIVIAILVIALIVTYFIVFTKPEFIFSKAIDKMFVKTEEFDSMKVDYKVKASVETDDINIKKYTEELEKCTLEFGFQLDSEAKEEMIELGLDYENEQVVNLQTCYNNEDVYLYLDELFEKYIKMDIDENEIEAIKEGFEQFSDENIKKSNEIMEIFRDELKKQIKEEGTFEKTKETINIGDEEKKVTKYTLDLSQEALINIFSNMCLNLSKDEEFLECMGDDSFKEELEEASEILIEASEELEENMLNVKINIYTKGVLNDFVGMDIEIGAFIDTQKDTIILNVLKETKDIYEYSIKIKSQGITAKVVSGKFEDQKEKDTKNEGKGKVIITAKIPEYIYSMKAKLEIDYSIELNNGIDKIDVSNSVNMEDLTEKDIDSITKKLMTRPLIGDFLTSMDGGLFEQAQTAVEETEKAQIQEAIALAKAEILADYYGGLITLDEVTEEKVKAIVEGNLGEKFNDVKVTKTPEKLEFTITVDGIENKMNLENLSNNWSSTDNQINSEYLESTGNAFDTDEETAKESMNETEERTILEEMLAVMEITDEGKIDYNSVITKMEQKYTVEYTYPNAKITGKNGTYNYIVSETEIKIVD